MIWKNKTHRFSASVCRHTGKPCPAAARVVRALAQAVDSAGRAASPDFEIEGSLDLDGCQRNCTARYSGNADMIRMYCDVSEQAEATMLDHMADALFSDDFIALPSVPSDEVPCAMLQAQTRRDARPAQVLENRV
ncbi:MAG: hypothetical protein GJ676_20240 [Rhodobacteraceae bacterium]|nr:hypothetical protein [Paracoccaceae bacterium]